MKKILQIFSVLTLFLSLSLPFAPLSLAAVNLDPCQGAGALSSNNRMYKPCLLNGADGGGGALRNIILAILVISAVVALIFLIWGGFKWITSGGDKAKVEAARNTIIAAIVGLIVAFLAYFILSIVLGIFNINLGDLVIPKIIP